MRLPGLLPVLLLSVVLAGPQTASAGAWPRLQDELGRWSGPRDIALLTDRDDPLDSPELQQILELLSAHGFTVRILPAGNREESALTVDVRFSGGSTSVALIRGADRAILTFERMATGSPPAAAPATLPPSSSLPQVSEGSPAPVGGEPTEVTEATLGPFPLSPPAVRIAVLGARDEALDLVLLRNASLDLATLTASGVRAGGTFVPPVQPTRALHLDVTDADGEGRRRLLATWGEDESGVYVGRNTRLHSWILTAAGGAVRPSSGDLESYLVGASGKALAQGRSPDRPWAGPLWTTAQTADGLSLGSRTPWPFEDIWQGVPWADGFGLFWTKPDRLALASLETGSPLAGGALIADLGIFTGPEVAVRLRDPEFRSGFSKEDQVKERLYSLPRRIALGPDGGAYTILRGRSPGLPLVGRPSGQDRLVRLSRRGTSLRMEMPFAPVDAFLLDFALVPSGEGLPRAVLLLSDDEGGEGTVYVLLTAGTR